MIILCAVLLIILAPIIAGTLQPRPTITGKNEFGDRPIQAVTLLVIMAARAIYPLVSKIAKEKYIAHIIGVKAAIAQIPEPTAVIRETSSFICIKSLSKNCGKSIKVA